MHDTKCHRRNYTTRKERITPLRLRIPFGSVRCETNPLCFPFIHAVADPLTFSHAKCMQGYLQTCFKYYFLYRDPLSNMSLRHTLCLAIYVQVKTLLNAYSHLLNCSKLYLSTPVYTLQFTAPFTIFTPTHWLPEMLSGGSRGGEQPPPPKKKKKKNLRFSPILYQNAYNKAQIGAPPQKKKKKKKKNALVNHLVSRVIDTFYAWLFICK